MDIDIHGDIELNLNKVYAIKTVSRLTCTRRKSTCIWNYIAMCANVIKAITAPYYINRLHLTGHIIAIYMPVTALKHT